MKNQGLTYWKVSELTQLPNNPRRITKEEFSKLVDSIRLNGFWEHRPLGLVRRDDRIVVLAGNQRLKAARKLKLDKVPGVLYTDTTPEDERDIVLLDNINNGDWDFGILQTDQAFEGVDFQDLGIQIEEEEKPKKKKKAKSSEEDDDGEEKSDNVPIILDVLFPSDNDYEIPVLDIDLQGGRLELPVTPWGANSRLTVGVNTYHFYVDDYRFEALFKDPVKLVLSNCKNIVEPNCSLHDQTPIAWGLQLIYKKRWLARYMQDLGVRVYVDLNVSRKFAEYNLLGVPKGWNAFFTRGLTDMADALSLDLELARRVSGKDTPNLIVYGGGKKAEKFCQENGLLYVTDFINAKNI